MSDLPSQSPSSSLQPSSNTSSKDPIANPFEKELVLDSSGNIVLGKAQYDLLNIHPNERPPEESGYPVDMLWLAGTVSHWLNQSDVHMKVLAEWILIHLKSLALAAPASTRLQDHLYRLIGLLAEDVYYSWDGMTTQGFVHALAPVSGLHSTEVVLTLRVLQSFTDIIIDLKELESGVLQIWRG